VRTFDGIAELQAAAGSDLGVSSWHEVTQEQVNLFAAATGDHQWIHVDPVRAASGPFGTTIAHGFLTLSLVPLFAAEVYRVEGIRMSVNYGCEKVRFPAPVPVGSRLLGSVRLDSVIPSSLGYTVAATVTVEIEGADKPGCVAQTLAVVVP
jgi:acyl dehydratase